MLLKDEATGSIQTEEQKMLTIRNQQIGKTETLSRDVRDNHSNWVHEQCGTSSESELQDMMSQINLREFAENPDSEDDCGMFMAAEDAAEYLEEME